MLREIIVDGQACGHAPTCLVITTILPHYITILLQYATLTCEFILFCHNTSLTEVNLLRYYFLWGSVM